MQPTSNGRRGRPPRADGVRSQAARRAKDAIEALTNVANDEKAPHADRVRAAQTLLDYATAQKAP